MKKEQTRNFITSLVLVPALLYACNRDGATDTNSAAWLIAQSEKLQIPAPVALPSDVPNGYTRIATYYATGVQKYKAQQKPGTNPAQFEWVFVAPRADLFDADNKKVGTHGAGPYWRLHGPAADSIYAQAFSPARTAAAPDAVSIDWLQLMPKTGVAPSGIFSEVGYIQRIATKGGKAPATAPLHAAETVEVPYTAVYRFSKKNP